MSKEHLSELIHKSDEAVYDVSAFLNEADNRDVVLKDVLNLCMNGTPKERFICLTVLANEQPELLKEKLPFLTSEILHTLDSNQRITLPVLSTIMNLKLVEYVQFCSKLLEYAKENDLPQIKSMAFRVLISLDWKSVQDSLQQVIEQGNERKVVDTMAYFRLKNGDVEFESFLSSLPEELQQKVSNLDIAISGRLETHYMQYAMRGR